MPATSPETLAKADAPGPRARLSLPAGNAGTVAPAPMPSDQLLQGRKAVEISHNGSVYRLQATRLGKLILTK